MSDIDVLRSVSVVVGEEMRISAAASPAIRTLVSRSEEAEAVPSWLSEDFETGCNANWQFIIAFLFI